MKIIYTAYSIIPSRSANSIHVMKMCQAFVENGHEVVLLAPDNKDEYEKNIDNVFKFYGVDECFKIKKIPIVNNKFRNIVNAFYLMKNYVVEKPDLVFGRDLFSCAISTFFGYKTIFESHSPYEEYGGKSKFLLDLMFKRKAFKKLVVISNALKKMYTKKNIYKCDNIIVAHDGADEVLDRENKIKLLSDNSSLNIGYIGHLYQGRGIDLIISIANKLQKHNFHIVGGTEEDIAFWKTELRKYEISNVYFYGYKTPQETIQYRNSFDILLAPYAKEVKVQGNVGNTSAYMSPLKIFEYMSHKKPIVTSDLPVLREVLSESNSILAKAESTESWIKAIKNLENEEIREVIANKAYSDFIENYTWKKRAENIIKEFNNEK
jgi:glycosyltransferase involved in cell wall biosynthesis